MRKLLAGLTLCGLCLAQTAVDEQAFARIRSEEAEHSQIMHTLHMFTDRYGPRLTGSPNHEAAAKWAVQQLTEWGFKNAHLEPWNFGHPGWLNERAAGYIVSPVHENLKFEVLGWTPSTKGPVTAPVAQIVLPRGPEIPPNPDAAGGRGGRGAPAGPQYQQPTQAELTAWMESNKSAVKGKMVMVGKAALVPVNFQPPALRRDDEQVRQSYDPNNPNAGRGFGRGGAGRGTPDPSRLTAAQVAEQVDMFLVTNGALLRINDAAMDHGLIRAFNNRTFDEKKVVPTVVMRNEDYGRIERLMADGDTVKLEFHIVNHWYPEGKTTYNVVAEIPGTDKADEVVMLGGHLDSWHAATGATDNAIGSSVMMEAARLLQALGMKPRRTVRVALWSGEEEGLLGSKAYVAQHFGTAEDPKPEWYKLDCYFNVDSGTGRLRGAGIFGPPEAAAVLRPALKPFEEWGVYGASVTNSRATGGTDSTSFNAAGLPGVGLAQDPIEYQSFTWHTNLDTYERIVPEDVKRAATEVGALVWHVANLDPMIPRFTKETMPKPPAAPGQ
jgi:carboxypeptidase Q